MNHRPAVNAAVFAGGLLFGAGLAVSQMTRPEVVLDFLQLDDLGLVLVMGVASLVVAAVIHPAARTGGRAPLTGIIYGLRRRDLDRNVVVGGGVFGVGWGLSGICPGAAYASLGIGNLPIAWAIAGMFIGAYLQGWVRSGPFAARAPTPAEAD